MRGGKNDTMSGGAKMERKRRPTAELRRRGRGTRESNHPMTVDTSFVQLTAVVPSLVVSQQQDLTINLMGQNIDNGWDWKFQWRRNFFDHEIDTVAAFMDEIDGAQIHSSRMDYLTWRAEPSGSYSTKSAYNFLMEDGGSDYEDNASRFMWNLKIPPRAAAFSWRIFKDRLPTKANLRRRQVCLPSYSCPLCDGEEETIGHVMFDCTRTRCLWWEILRWADRVGPFTIDPKDHFTQFSRWSSKRCIDNRWAVLWIALSMTIWKHRNSMVFNNQNFNSEKVMDEALFHSWAWLKWEFMSTSNAINNETITDRTNAGRRAIFQQQNVVSADNQIRWKLGRGDKFLFWEDPWGDEGVPLKDQFHELFSISSQRDLRVAEVGSWTENGWVWNMVWRRHLFDNEVQLASIFIDHIHQIRVNNNLNDTWVWGAESSGILSTKFGYQVIKSEMVHSRLPTKDNLIKRQIQVDNDLCPFCHNQPESASHLFFTCGKTMAIWWEYLSWVKEDKVFHCRPLDNFIQHYSSATSKVSNTRRTMWWIAATV
ncbi:putative ribonuclease H protein [Glycine max]|nr:putative ribonuclease H protein [Glycine max]